LAAAFWFLRFLASAMMNSCVEGVRMVEIIPVRRVSGRAGRLKGPIQLKSAPGVKAFGRLRLRQGTEISAN
jgi:hypothetical protein